MNVDNFLARVRTIMGSVIRSIEVSSNEGTLESGIARLDALMRNVNRMSASYPECANLLPDLSEAIAVISDMKRSAESMQIPRPAVLHGGNGRPPYMVSKDQLEMLLDLNFTNKEIADLVHISVSSVKRRLRQFNLERKRKFTIISNHELDERIRNITAGNTMLGQRNVMGHLLADGIRVQRDRVAEALLRVDPAAVAMRWSQTISRRTYSVPGPNALWHIDGNHKLIRWGFVIHGGIDGYSRTVVFVSAATNNRASTVFENFVEATNVYGVPSRVRCDHGGENIEVAMFMNTYRGPNRGSCITGRSVHNQRIERFWRDLYQGCTSYYRDFFAHLEMEGVLNVDDNIQMWCLHYIFLPRLNRALKRFQAGWNHHRLSTEHGKTPHQLYVQGVLQNRGTGQRGVDDLFYEPLVTQDTLPDDFGVDWEGPVMPEEVVVEVPNVNCPLTQAQFERAKSLINPLAQSGNGIEQYIRLIALAHE